MIARGKVCVDGVITRDHLREVDRFCEVEREGELLQPALARLYLMLNKPAGYLSATTDSHHPTVLDLIEHPCRSSLHIAGRLDRSSTGLLLLTNDGDWSRNLTLPGSNIPKVYLVETVDPIPKEAVRKFEQGFHFACEGIVTRPARLEILAPCKARVTICEGKYHQVKRMFHRIDENRLVSLHRERIGEYVLPPDLPAGEWRTIDPSLL